MTKASLTVKGRKDATRLELIVDPGSVYTWIPSKTLGKLGVPKDDVVDFTTIEGRRVRRSVGEVLLGYDGVSRHCVVVFGRPGDATVLGVTALENLALEVNPVTKKLRRARALAAY